VKAQLFLGIDGGGTQCRARLATDKGAVIGVGAAGPGNIRLGLEEALANALEAGRQSLAMAGLGQRDFGRVTACLALAGATEPVNLAAARRHPHPFAGAFITSDVHAACLGAHGGRDGGVVVVGTGSVGFAQVAGRQCRVGGWGFPLSDEGSGAWLGAEALRRVLWAHDGRVAATDLLIELFATFASDPHAVVRFMTEARPRDYAKFAPLVVDHAAAGDTAGAELMRGAAGHVEALLARLRDCGAHELTLMGGLAAPITPWLAPPSRAWLVPPPAMPSMGRCIWPAPMRRSRALRPRPTQPIERA
jgi:glucosamine kinase